MSLEAKDVESLSSKEAGGGNVVQPDQVAEARRTFTYNEGRRIMRRCDLYILPILMLSYLLKNLDVNVIFYVATMNSTGDRAHENVKTV
ncbi:hypothetical protein JCM6882_005456, partial [Rhodosporidiobolus microsporus]